MTKDEATKVVTKYLSENMSNHLTFSYKNYQYDVEVEQIEARFDIESAINFAYSIGRNKGTMQNIKDYASSLMNKIDIEPVLKYNEQALDDYMSFLEVSLPDQVEDPRLLYR